LDINTGGASSSDWMIIGSYSNAGGTNKPIIDGTTNCITLDTSGLEYIRIENLRCTDTSSGIIALNQGGTTDIHLLNIDADNSTTNGIIARRIDGYTIENCHVRDVGLGGQVGAGILVYGADGVAQANQIKNTKALNCTVRNAFSDGFVYHASDVAPLTPIGENHYIFNCSSYDCENEQGFDVTAGDNIVMRDCYSEGNYQGAANFKTNNHLFVINFTSFDERRYGVGYSVPFYPYTFGNSTIRNSVFHDFGFKWGMPLDLSRNLRLTNNLFIATDIGVDEFIQSTNSDNRNLLAKNNIFTATVETTDARAVHLISLSTIDSYFFNNCWWDTSGDHYHWRVGSNLNWAQWSAEARVTDDIYENPDITNIAGKDYTLQSVSPCIDTGVNVTQTNGAGSSSTTLIVDDAQWFHDGFGLTDGDTIRVGGSTVTVTDVNYDTDTLTITPAISWSDGEGVHFPYNGAAPDMGAREYGDPSYTDTIRTDGIDYFTWMGANTTASTVDDLIDNFDLAAENISIWDGSISWTTGNWLWSPWTGTGGGTDWTVNTFDVIRTYLTTDEGDITITMTSNPDIDYSKYIPERTVTLTYTGYEKGLGYNFTGYTAIASTTLSDIVDMTNLVAGEAVMWWNDTDADAFKWEPWIVNFMTSDFDHSITPRCVISTKIGANRQIDIGSI